ncbi:MAG: hypothetical protein GXO54_03540 [Chloroflexi bacterium]|nr:hypothetical protein [Chloroflexota bacterium]
MDDPKTLADQAARAFRRGKYDQAAALYARAAEAYDAAGQALLAAEMRSNQAVALLQAERPADALALLEPLPAFFAQHQDLRREGLAWGNIGSALEALGRVDEAMEAYRRAWKRLEAAGEGEAVAYVAQALSRLQLNQKRPLEALVTMDQGLAASPKGLHRRLRALLRWPFRFLGS